MRLVLGYSILLLFSTVSTVCAQTLTRRDVGTRIRVATTDADTFQGTVVALGPDTLRLAVDGVERPLALAMTSLRTIAHSEGVDRGSGALSGLRNGAIVGAVLVGAGLLIDRRSQSECFCGASVLLVPAAVLTTTIGAAVGALSAPERWSDPRPVGARGDAGRGVLLRIGVRVRF